MCMCKEIVDFKLMKLPHTSLKLIVIHVQKPKVFFFFIIFFFLHTQQAVSSFMCVICASTRMWLFYLPFSSPPSTQSASGWHILTYAFHIHAVLAWDDKHSSSWLFQRDDMEAIPGYLSLHQTADIMTLKWTPNQLMNGSVGDLDYERRCKIIQLQMDYEYADCVCQQSPCLILLVIPLIPRISNV